MTKRERPTFTARPHRAFSAGLHPSADFDYEVRGLECREEGSHRVGIVAVE